VEVAVGISEHTLGAPVHDQPDSMRHWAEHPSPS
jgi:hypothetical protein